MRYHSNDKKNMHRNCYRCVLCFLVAGILSSFERMHENTRSNEYERRQIMKFSEKGQDKLKQLEGFLPVLTADGAGYPTIGYGHKAKPGENWYGIISKEKASSIMMQDIAPLEGFLNNYINPKLTQNQFDALIIFMYNIGVTAFLNSSIFQDVKAAKFEEATVPWAKWINITKKEIDVKTGEMIKKLIPVKGLINRRLQEIQLFRS